MKILGIELKADHFWTSIASIILSAAFLAAISALLNDFAFVLRIPYFGYFALLLMAIGAFVIGKYFFRMTRADAAGLMIAWFLVWNVLVEGLAYLMSYLVAPQSIRAGYLENVISRALSSIIETFVGFLVLYALFSVFGPKEPVAAKQRKK
jgi:hypothetical protein